MRGPRVGEVEEGKMKRAGSATCGQVDGRAGVGMRGSWLEHAGDVGQGALEQPTRG